MTFEKAWSEAKLYTCLGKERSRTLFDFARRAKGVEGDIAELGVWRGGSALILARALPDRKVHLFDTFKGYPAGTSRPVTMVGRFGWGEPRWDTEALMVASGVSFVTYIGDFTLIPWLFTRPLACAHIDCDLGEPAAAGLARFWPLIAPAGVLIIDDYGQSDADCPGLKTAVDSWRASIGDHEWEDRDGQIWIRKL